MRTCVSGAPGLVISALSHHYYNFNIYVTLPCLLSSCDYYLLRHKDFKMSDCTICNKSSGQIRHKICCSECKSPCHLTCANVSKEDLEFMTTENKTWRCPRCSQQRKVSMSGTSDNAGDNVLSQILARLDEASNDRKRIEAEISKAFDFVHEKIDEQKVAIEKQSQSLAEYLNLMEGLKAENANLKTRLVEMEARLEDNEQYLRSNTLEVQGVPESRNEDVYDIVRKVGVALDMNFQREAIDICHRLGKRPGSDNPAGIIVKFVRREDKIKMLEKRRIKRNLNTRDIGYPGEANPVYVNESLSPARRRLLAAARTAKREKNYTYIWVRNGKIFMRKNPGDPVVVITSHECIAKLN